MNTQTADMLELHDLATGDLYRVSPRRLIIAGFTGRVREAVEAHLHELRAFGAVVPDTTPVFLELEPALLTNGDEIVVDGAFTSGEVEPVVVVTGGTRLLTVGSDHTDRELERESLLRSKQGCPKVVGDACVRVDAVADWDGVLLTSWANGESEPYQVGSLQALLPLDDVIERLADNGTEVRDGDVLFLGTVPVTGGDLRPSQSFRAQMQVADQPDPLTVEYRVVVGGEPRWETA